MRSMLSYLIENKYLLSIDLYFAKKVLKEAQSNEALILLSLLMASFRLGHVCLNKKDLFFEMDDELKEELKKIIFVGETKLPDFVVERVTETCGYFVKPVIYYQNCFYLQKNWTYETIIVKKIKQYLLELLENSFSKNLFEEFLTQNVILQKEQKEAIIAALSQKLSFISGGPGTGKTFTATKMIEAFAFSLTEKRKLKVILAAPTGKASFHLKSKIPKDVIENIEIETKTLHALLGVVPDRHLEFGNNKIAADLVIVDEASMIDLRLMAHLLSSIHATTRLVLVGDKNQLAPIETGQPFSDLCSLSKTVFLQKTLRFANPNIIQFTKGICEKNVDMALSSFDKNDPCLNFIELEENYSQFKRYLDFFPSPQKDPFQVSELLEEIKNFRILCSLKQGFLGVDQINAYIVSQLLQKGSYGDFFAFPILIVKNDYNKDLFNGMMGIMVTTITNKMVFSTNKALSKAYFLSETEGVRVFVEETLPKWELCYALSVHKSQGSEFDEVVSVIPEGSEVFGKELLYTAATRAKKAFTLISKKPIVSKMIDNDGLKCSLLKKRAKALR